MASRKKKKQHETTRKKDNKKIEKLGGSTVLQMIFFKNPWRSKMIQWHIH